MACKIERPEPQTLFNRIKNLFSVNVLGGAPVIPESNEWYVVANDYAAMEKFYAISDQLAKETDPATACCENLYRMAAQNGVFPRPALFAEGYVTLTGDANAQLYPAATNPDTIEVSTDTGVFVSSGTVPRSLDANGQAVIRVRALKPGASLNATNGTTTGTLITNFAGVNRSVTIAGGNFCGGSDQETCEQFRTRYLERLRYKPRATSDWVKQKIAEWPCVTRVCEAGESCCDPNTVDNCGCGDYAGSRLQFYAMFDNSFDCGIAPQCIIDEINLWMFGSPQGRGLGQVEMGVCGDVRLVIAASVNVRVDTGDCWTPDEQIAVREALEDLFTTLCPSTTLTLRQVELAIADIVGSTSTFEVFYTSNDTNSVVTNNNIVPICDAIPCLTSLTFTGPAFSTGGCI